MNDASTFNTLGNICLYTGTGCISRDICSPSEKVEGQNHILAPQNVQNNTQIFSEILKPKSFQGLLPLDPHWSFAPGPTRGPKASLWTPPILGFALRARHARYVCSVSCRFTHFSPQPPTEICAPACIRV